jgi:hypothetical protein
LEDLQKKNPNKKVVHKGLGNSQEHDENMKNYVDDKEIKAYKPKKVFIAE